MLFTSDRPQPEAEAELDDPASARKRARIMLVVGGYGVALGLFLQWYASTALLRCGPHAQSGAACVVSHRMLIGLVPTGTEHVTGVQTARYVISRGMRRRSGSSYGVILDTADGERTVTWSKSLEAAHGLVGTINRGLKAGAAFEASLDFAFLDWAMRTTGLLFMAAGVAFAALGLRGGLLARARR